MKSFGIAMVVLGAFTAFLGLYFAFTVPDTSSLTCTAETGSSFTTCRYDAGDSGESNPGSALRTSTGALALCIVGAGLFAGGLAGAAAANHPARSLPPGAAYPPVGAGGPPPPPPPGYGQQR